MQPNESVYIKMNSKLPGLSMQTVSTELDLTYRRRFSDLKIPEAYESLILDALKGDHSNFVRDDELDASWRIFTPLLHYLDHNTEITPMEYPYGMPPVLDMHVHVTRDSMLNLFQDLEARPYWMISHPRTDTNSAIRRATNGAVQQMRIISFECYSTIDGRNFPYRLQRAVFMR